MNLKRLMKKTLLGGGDLISGHISDAIQRKEKTGKSFRECLEDSIKETVAEDMPVTSHIYQMGHTDGKKEGTAEQAERDTKKMEDMQKIHDKDRREWQRIDAEKDKLIDAKIES